MNIIQGGAETRSETHSVRQSSKAGAEKTSYSAMQGSQKACTGGFVLDISGIAGDNSAYAPHGRTIEELMQEVGQEDLKAQRDYMVVMSGTVSDEDFAKMQEDGFHPGSTDIETFVTILDEIKAALLKGGEQVVGYTDTISDEVLSTITGSRAFAEELKAQFEKRDIPLTRENVAAVANAWNMLKETDSLSEGNVKYMVENGLEPTPENLYTAKYSSSDDAGRQGRGYYAAGGVSGYYAKKPDEIDFEKLRSQMEKVIEEAGYEADGEKLTDARWLVEKGIPLTAETFSLMQDIKVQHLPVSYQDLIRTATCAIADGRPPQNARLGRDRTYREEAAELAEKVASIDDRAADIVMAKDLPFTLRNLFAAWDKMLSDGKGGQGKGALQGRETVQETAFLENAHGRRLLEEVRLSMTVEANLRLLRRGYQIETAPLEELVTKLKEAEESYAKALVGQSDAVMAKEGASLYRETLQTLQGISASPAAALYQVSGTDTLREVYAYGRQRQLDYEKAGQTYETMMTFPRKDMGDSIQKAFRNVDDILKDMDLERSEANRRAVRILGYNSLEITEESISQIREKDDLLSGVIKEMKPGRVLNMIRDGVNPLNMSLEELRNFLSQQEDTAQDIESYSRFLYKLEKQEGISKEERSAYIGIYRLVRQIEKGDGAAIGALWQSGAEFTLGNLLREVRSAKRGSMDYSVDDGFSAVRVQDTGKESITSQIAKGYMPDFVQDIQQLEQLLESLESAPGRMAAKELLEGAGDGHAGEEFDQIMYGQVRSAMKSEDAVLQYLSDYSQPATADNLLAAANLLNDPRAIWQGLKELKGQDKAGQEDEVKKDGEDSLEDAGAEVIKALDDGESAQKAYGGLMERLQAMLEDMAFTGSYTALDVKAMSNLYKQMSFMGNMAREENYEIPAQIGGKLTSINLKIIHDSQKEGQVAITFEADAIGKTSAKFKLTGQGVEGICICNSMRGCKLLKEGRVAFGEKLSGEGLKAGDIYFAFGEDLDTVDLALKGSGMRQEDVGSKPLYRAARAFIGFVQEIASNDSLAVAGNKELFRNYL